MKLLHLAQIPAEGVAHQPEIKKQVLIKNGEIPQLTGFSQAVFKPGQACEEHRHPTMYEVYFLLEGEATLFISGREVKAAKNDCVVIEPGESHRAVNNSRQDFIWIYFGVATD